MGKVRDGMFGKRSPKRAVVPAICHPHDIVHHACLRGHAMKLRRSVQRLRNPRRKLHQHYVVALSRDFQSTLTSATASRLR